MKLPALYSLSQSRAEVTAFGGLDRTERCAEGQFAAAQDLSARRWPALCPRPPRRLLTQLSRPHGLYAKNGLIWVSGTTLYYNGAAVGTVADSDKTFCGIGSKVLVFPDKLCLDTAALTLTPLGARWAAVGQVRFTPCRLDGGTYEVTTTGAAQPESPANGDYWLDTSGEADVLRVYSAASDTWAAVSTPYLRIGAEGIGANFAVGDTVTLAGVSADAVGESAAAALNADCVVWDRGEDYITVTALLAKAAVQETDQGEVTVERRIPDLDYLTECDNRVWGVAKDGHEIYACKLGDPTNWFSYPGTAADSYTVSVGSDGPFTGAATCMGYVLLFKEGLIHRVYGSKPANYQVVTLPCPGVKAGCEGSLATVDSTLYYLSPRGPMACDGGLPEPVGAALGEDFAPAVTAAAGGAAGGCWWLSVTENGAPALYVYRPQRTLWHRQSDPGFGWLAANGSALAALTADGALWELSEADPVADGDTDAPVPWYAETAPLHLRESGRRFLTRLELRLTLADGAAVRVLVRYDETGPWQQVAALRPGAQRSAVLPVRPRRCTCLRLRLEGEGDCTLHALSRTFTKGSEL